MGFVAFLSLSPLQALRKRTATLPHRRVAPPRVGSRGLPTPAQAWGRRREWGVEQWWTLLWRLLPRKRILVAGWVTVMRLMTARTVRLPKKGDTAMTKIWSLRTDLRGSQTESDIWDLPHQKRDWKEQPSGPSASYPGTRTQDRHTPSSFRHPKHLHTPKPYQKILLHKKGTLKMQIPKHLCVLTTASGL